MPGTRQGSPTDTGWSLRGTQRLYVPVRQRSTRTLHRRERQLARTGWRAQTFWYDFVCHVAIYALGLKLSMGVIVPDSTMAKKGSSVEIGLAGVMRGGAVARVASAARALRVPFRRQAAALPKVRLS